MATKRSKDIYQAPKVNPLVQAATVVAIVLGPVAILALVGIFSRH